MAEKSTELQNRPAWRSPQGKLLAIGSKANKGATPDPVTLVGAVMVFL
jgi:hypothetical protein